MREVVSGTVGVILLIAFLGVLLWWIKSVPLTIIVVVGLGIILYDFVTTLRYGEDGAPANRDDPAIRRG